MTDLAQFHNFFGIYMRVRTLLDMVGKCMGCLFEDKLTGTSGSYKLLRCHKKRLQKNGGEL